MLSNQLYLRTRGTQYDAPPAPNGISAKFRTDEFHQPLGKSSSSPFGLLNVCHKENKQPVKSALKRPPGALQKSTNSAFTQLRAEVSSPQSESEGYGNSPSPKPQKEWNVDHYSAGSQPPTDFNSPGPSENSVDSGFGKPTKKPDDEITQQKAREQKIAQNMAKFETLLRSTNQTTAPEPTLALSSGPLLSSLSQLRLNA